MCTIVFSYKNTPGYRLVLIANRDEFSNRPTAPLAYWPDNVGILAGRDLQEGGTWLGVNSRGKLSAITNYREPQTSVGEYSSRGEVVLQYLSGNGDEEDYLQNLIPRAQDYRGFNLLIGDSDEMYCFSNRDTGVKRLPPGVYGLSNHLLDSGWPKVKRGKMLLESALNTPHFGTDELFGVLGDTHLPPEKDLPDTGIGITWERLLASIFITSGMYGTRSSAVITIRDDGYIEFTERTFLHDDDGWQMGGENFFAINGE